MAGGDLYSKLADDDGAFMWYQKYALPLDLACRLLAKACHCTLQMAVAGSTKDSAMV